MYSHNINEDRKHVFTSAIDTTTVFVFLIHEEYNGYTTELLDLFQYPSGFYTRKEMILDALNNFPNNHCWEGKEAHVEPNNWIDYGYSKTKIIYDTNSGHQAVVIASLNNGVNPRMIKKAFNH